MLRGLEARVVDVGGEKIEVFQLSSPKSGYRAFYQNNDTRTLDKRFGLRGQTIVEPRIINELVKATQPDSLGNPLV